MMSIHFQLTGHLHAVGGAGDAHLRSTCRWFLMCNNKQIYHPPACIGGAYTVLIVLNKHFKHGIVM